MGHRKDLAGAAVAAAATPTWVGSGTLAASAEGTEAVGDPTEVRATMGEIFESLRVLLPLSVSVEKFSSPSHQPEIQASLAALSDSAAALAGHTRGRTPDLGFLARSMAGEAAEIQHRYERGRYESAAFLLQELTEYCVACHSARRSPGDSPRAEHFIDDTTLATLPPVERVQLQLATRRFDDALSTLEEIIASPSTHPAQAFLPLTEHLTISIRVTGDLDRPTAVLKRFSHRPDLWRHLRLDVQRWLVALRELRGVAAAEPSLESARRVIDAGKRTILFPADRAALVHYVVASTILHRYIESHPIGGPDVAEAYYLLGLTESRIGRAYWVSQADFFLETAIRMAPKQPFAEQAYALLEEETILEWSGSSGIHLPANVEQRLSELRELIDER